MPYLLVFGVVLLACVVILVQRVRVAGPRQLDDAALARAREVARWTRAEPGTGWRELGSRTTTRGLDLHFDHDDDPQAEATLLAPGARPRPVSTYSNVVVVPLAEQFVTHHVHTAGWVFRVSLRGTGAVVGREVKLTMQVASASRPHGGRIENDDDLDAAVGDWIEVEWAELLAVESAGERVLEGPGPRRRAS